MDPISSTISYNSLSHHNESNAITTLLDEDISHNGAGRCWAALLVELGGTFKASMFKVYMHYSLEASEAQVEAEFRVGILNLILEGVIGNLSSCLARSIMSFVSLFRALERRGFYYM